jgi:light-harvesting complex I chlorophyll a/b binding protein 1
VAAGFFSERSLPFVGRERSSAETKICQKLTRNPKRQKKKIAESKQEWGEFPMSERTSPLTSLTYDEYKNNVSAEIIHGRFAMLGVTGAWAQENLVGTPWFMAGEECTFDSCSISYLNNKFEASYDGALLGIIFLEIVLMGGAEGYRTGLLENPFDDVTAGSVFPGGRFDPLNFSEGKAANFFGEDLDTLKIKELKHCRLAMLAWLGILAQSVSTNPNGAGPDAVGPVANWSAHVADVVHCNVVDRSGCVF